MVKKSSVTTIYPFKFDSALILALNLVLYYGLFVNIGVVNVH